MFPNTGCLLIGFTKLGASRRYPYISPLGSQADSCGMRSRLLEASGAPPRVGSSASPGAPQWVRMRPRRPPPGGKSRELRELPGTRRASLFLHFTADRSLLGSGAEAHRPCALQAFVLEINAY